MRIAASAARTSVPETSGRRCLVTVTTTRMCRAVALLAMSMAATAAVANDEGVKVEDDPRLGHLRGLAVSGRALASVADRIDPAHPLGDCAVVDMKPRVKAVLDNVRNAKGHIRVSLFGRDPAQWVRTKGAKLLRFDVPATRGHMEICMPLPDGDGTYALALYHDENADGKYSLAGEGYGFSNNARAGLFGPPDHRAAAFVATGALTEIAVRIRY